MATRNLLSRFRSLSRPSLSGGGSSYLSAAKKQASAEDLIFDQQYSDGIISAEAYKAHLQVRLGRSWNTPRTIVSLRQKIADVDRDILDARVDQAYSSGEITTNEKLSYEKRKLESITETNSEAYFKQKQIVDSLTNKVEKEARANFRREELNRISLMPEDSSEQLWAKAQVYDQLAQQARLDGDEQQAISLETTRNNYQTSAKRAEINDLITSTRLSVSETPRQGLGVPSAQAGAELYAKLTGQAFPSGMGADSTSGSATSGDSSAGVATTGYVSPAIKNKLETLDRQQKSIDRLYGQLSDTASMINTYDEAINQASGDQRTQLEIARNNLIDSYTSTENQIALITQGIQDTVISIQEAKASAAESAFKKDANTVSRQFSLSENELEREFINGKISKEEYIAKGLALTQEKARVFNEIYDGMVTIGDASAGKWLDSLEETINVHEDLIQVGQNINDYEAVAVDPGGSFTNLFGRKLSPGEVALLNVRQFKDQGRWDENYVQDGGIWHKVFYPPEVVDETGYVIRGITAEELAKYQGKAFIYSIDENGIQVQKPVEHVTFLDEENRPVTKPVLKDFADKMTEYGVFQRDESGLLKEVEPPKAGLSLQIAAKVQEEMQKRIPGYENVVDAFQGRTDIIGEVGKRWIAGAQKMYVEPLQNIPENLKETAQKLRELPGVVVDNVEERIGDAGRILRSVASQSPLRSVQNLASNTIRSVLSPKLIAGVTNIFNRAKNFITNEVDKSRILEGGSLVKPVSGNSIDSVIVAEAKNAGVDPDLLLRIAQAESNFDPEATASANGFDGKRLPYSSASGLFQFTDATWEDAQKRGYVPRGASRFDPVMNTRAAARFIADGELWRWNASRHNWENAPTPTSVPTTTTTPTPTPTMTTVPVPSISQMERSVSPTPTKSSQEVVAPIVHKPSFLENLLGSAKYEFDTGGSIRTPSGLLSPIPESDWVQPKNFVQKATESLRSIQLPKIEIPKIDLPKFEMPKIQIPNVQNTVSNIKNTFTNTVNKAKDWLGRFF